MSDANKEVIRREVEDLLVKGDFALIDELVGEDYVSHDPAAPEPIRGRDGFRALVESYRSGLGELHVMIHDQIAEGDLVVTRWTASGRHEGDLFGIAPTGKDLKIAGISIERVENGRIVEDWTNWDALGLMRQLGVVPELVA